MIPIHLSGAVIACIFALMALVAVALTWVMCVIADEWREAVFDDEAKGKAEDWE